MSLSITFHHMESSAPLEEHARDKIKKIEEFIKNEGTPHIIELKLHANPKHPHHLVELRVKTKNQNLHAHTEDPDMYTALDKTIATMLGLLRKEMGRLKDKHHKHHTEKTDFSNGN